MTRRTTAFCLVGLIATTMLFAGCLAQSLREDHAAKPDDPPANVTADPWGDVHIVPIDHPDRVQIGTESDWTFAVEHRGDADSPEFTYGDMCYSAWRSELTNDAGEGVRRSDPNTGYGSCAAENQVPLEPGESKQGSWSWDGRFWDPDAGGYASEPGTYTLTVTFMNNAHNEGAAGSPSLTYNFTVS